MIFISYKDLSKIESRINGHHGTIYKVDDNTVYKIYHDKIKSIYSEIIDNPCLKYPKKKIYLLKKKQPKIKFTDFFIDTVYVEGEFKGFALPYYNGGTLESIVNKEASQKIDIARQILRNGSELIDNNIYPRDCSLRNIMLHNGEVKFIDLDDYCTIVKNHYDELYYNISYLAIGNTILKLFSEENNNKIGTAKFYIKRQQSYFIDRYKDIKEYIQEKSIGHKFLLINEENDIELIKGYNNENPSDILMSYNSQDYSKNDLIKTAKEYKKQGLQLYDFVDPNDLEKYFANQNVSTLHELKGNQFIKKNRSS